MSKKNKVKLSKKQLVFRVLGIVLLTLSIGVLLLEPIKGWYIKRISNETGVANLTREQIEENQKRQVTYNFEDIKPLNAYEVLKQGTNPDDLPTIGSVAMPELDMNLPIYKGVSNEGMFFGAGTLREGQVMGESNYAIASHHSITKGALFEPLLRAKVGMKAYLTDLNKVYEYEITQVLDVDPSRVDLIAPTDNSILTMVTCDASLVNRIVVQGRLSRVVPIDNADSNMLKAFALQQTKHLSDR